MADSADDLLARAREARQAWLDSNCIQDGCLEAADEAYAELDALLSSGGPPPAAWKRSPVIATLDATPAVLAERDAEIARLTAELDAIRAVPVEHVITAGLEAAMTADPNREDGAVIRVTDGQRKAYVWKAATREWEQVP